MWDLRYKLKLWTKKTFTDDVLKIEDIKKGSLIKIVYDIKHIRNRYAKPYVLLLVSDISVARDEIAIRHLGIVENGFFQNVSGVVYFNDKRSHLEKPTMQDYLFFADKARIHKLKLNKKKILLGEQENKVRESVWRFICYA